MKYAKLSVVDSLNDLKSSQKGLTIEEAEIRLKKFGPNKLKETKKRAKILKFLDEFKNLMLVILLISAIFSFVLSLVKNESFLDSIIIIIIVILNAILSYIQEAKADKAVDSLKKLQEKKVKVKRDNNIYIVNSENIVKGDILVLEAGDQVPADARIIWEKSLKVDESALTGESVPVEKNIKVLKKDVPLSERINLLYSGTSIVYGKCHAVVSEVGMATELGNIALSLETEEKEVTPLQKKINEISKVLSLIILLVVLIMFIIGIFKGIDLAEIIMLSISLAVAAVPEGLPTVITITLSLGMSSLAKNKAIVKKMSSVETLGSTEIICSDKTGTITQNKMKVKQIYYDNKLLIGELLPNENLLLKAMVLNNDVQVNKKEYIGDPTEIAIYNYCEKCLIVKNIQNKYSRIDEIPFDSERKMMSTIHKFDNEIKIFTKGSFDSIIDQCSKILENNKIVSLTDKKKKELKLLEKKESQKAYRIIAFAYKDLKNNYSEKTLEKNLIFIGMVCMIDPPREDVKEAIALCKSAHIKPIMITGDGLNTAISIAKEIGILENAEEAILGSELEKFDSDELKDIVQKYSVYARVSPANKLAIVNAWKENNKIVSMTGDGVNDAPALKSADIGVGMGITGTEVSKEVSDVVLSDDSFSSIVSAVREGRRIYDNIRNVLVYLLTGNIAEILVVFIGIFLGLEIFNPLQLLYINLITDTIPAIALAFEKEEKNIMNRNIRKRNSAFFTPFLIASISIAGIFKTLAVMVVYFLNFKLYGFEIAATMTFLTIILLEITFTYSCRNLKKSVIDQNMFSNSYVNKSVLLLIVVQIIVFLSPLKNIFNIVNLNIIQLLYCFIIVIVAFFINELMKTIIIRLFND